jgi:hypothetical protein
MTRIKRVDSTHATRTKELDGNTIETTIHAVFATKFATAIGQYASAFKSYELLKEHITLRPPQ